MAINLSDPARKALITSIKHYFQTERDEEIGDLAAGFFLDFILEELAPSIYNKGIRDAQASMQRTVTDLDLNLCMPEPAR